MKNATHFCTFFTIICASVAVQVQAQTATDFGKAQSSFHKNNRVASNPFEDTEMTTTKELASFGNLPDLRKPTWAIITNTDGEFIKESKINPTYNAMDIHRLPKGLYFVTIVYRSKCMKAFTLNVEE